MTGTFSTACAAVAALAVLAGSAHAAEEVELLAGEEASFSPDGAKLLFQRPVGDGFRVGNLDVG